MIILEGPDGAGKSTLARVLANIYSRPIFHAGGAPSPDEYRVFADRCIMRLHDNYICDRVQQISEYVYGPVMNDRQLSDINDILNLYAEVEKCNGILVYCRPSGIENMAEIQTEEDYDTPENTARLKKNHAKLVAGYDEVFGELESLGRMNNVFLYNYKAPGEFKRLFDFITSKRPELKSTRPKPDTYFLRMAHLAAERGTCARRKVGCILVNERKHVLATGYNGRPAGMVHCTEGDPCPAAACPSGTALDGCEALHAEQNALLQCEDTQAIETAYVTCFPCITCIKLLLNTSCRRIVFTESYTHPEAVELWERAGRYLTQIEEDQTL